MMLTDKYFLVFGLITFIIAFFFAGIWSISDNVVLSVFLFFAAGIYFDSFNGLKQFISIAIVFYVTRYPFEDKFKKYCIGILMAAPFHYSAIIMIPMFFIKKLDIDMKKACITALIVIVGGHIVEGLISYILQFTRYRYFLTSVEYEVEPTRTSILYISIISIVTFGYRAIYKNKTSEKLHIMIITSCLCGARPYYHFPYRWYRDLRNIF